MLNSNNKILIADEVNKKFFKTKKKSLVSICKYFKPKNNFYNYSKNNIYKIDLEQYKSIYTINGSIYIFKNSFFLQNAL
tara:strand:+ start:14019 stop:14255 length:237 start_codon:yes stop_codon:yes gene_type:complete